MQFLVELLINFIEIYIYIIIIYILLGYFREARGSKIYEILKNLCEPLLNLFRFATYQSISFAPILAFILLKIIQYILRNLQF